MFKSILKFFLSINFVAIVCFLASALYPLTWPVKVPVELWVQDISQHLMLAALFFINIYWFFPKLFTRTWGGVYVIVIIASIYLLVIGNAWVHDIAHVDRAIIKEWSTPGHPFVPDHHWDAKWTIFLSFVFLGLSNITAFVRKMQSGQLAFQMSEKERITAELSFLKAQINPHFFFNTLHTIYSLMDTDPGAAKESLYTLSHMMRYVIYDTKNDHASLCKEIKFIEDYITLMKERIPANTQVIFEKQPGLRDVKIAPMLLLPIVENAFKHGIRATQPSYVYIAVSESQDKVKFEVKNSLFSTPVKPLEENGGIGFSNTRRRLDLLYPGKYELTVENDDLVKEYSVTLTVDTHDH